MMNERHFNRTGSSGYPRAVTQDIHKSAFVSRMCIGQCERIGGLPNHYP